MAVAMAVVMASRHRLARAIDDNKVAKQPPRSAAGCPAAWASMRGPSSATTATAAPEAVKCHAHQAPPCGAHGGIAVAGGRGGPIARGAHPPIVEAVMKRLMMRAAMRPGSARRGHRRCWRHLNGGHGALVPRDSTEARRRLLALARVRVLVLEAEVYEGGKEALGASAWVAVESAR